MARKSHAVATRKTKDDMDADSKARFDQRRN